MPHTQARVQEETNDARNALEAYIYSLRGRLGDALAPYAEDGVRLRLLAQLDDMEVCAAVPRPRQRGSGCVGTELQGADA